MFAGPSQLDFNQSGRSGGTPGPGKQTRRKTFGSEQVQLLIHAATEQWRTVILLGYYAGLRLGDAIKLTWESVNFADNCLQIEVQKTGEPLQVRPEARALANLRHHPVIGRETMSGLIRDHFQTQSRTGFDYAYTFPGMNRVLQAVGRAIRSETDQGVVLLIDARFREARYRRLFPPTWRCVQVRNLAALQKMLSDFWQRQK